MAAFDSEYDPALLLTMPRGPKRAEIGIAGGLPFTGVDIWTAYELSWLTKRGKPEIAIATLAFPADSPNLIESQSLKFYLNSFSHFPAGGAGDVAALLRRDLSAAAGAPVEVALAGPSRFSTIRVAEMEGELIDGIDIAMEDFRANPSFLTAGPGVAEEVLLSHLLKTVCPITGQPDWGTIQVRYRGPAIDREGLLRYIVSLRRHADFVERCVEMIFMDFLRQVRPEELTVYGRFTRRGGIDINPFRTNCGAPQPANLRTARQ